MNPRGTCRLSLIATLITALAVLAICPKAVFAQSTNRQIGTQFEVTAEPLVPRPREQPCVVPLFANYQFAFFSESTQTFEFAPGNCSGPWEKVVLEADFSENAGAQFDRTAIIYLGNLNLYFGTTPEPLSTVTNTWHVERDITDYSAALSTAQQEWIDHTTSLVAPTVLVHPSCNSWYNGGNVPGKKRMYMGYTGGIPEYRRRCDEIAAAGYTGFKLA